MGVTSRQPSRQKAPGVKGGSGHAVAKVVTPEFGSWLGTTAGVNIKRLMRSGIMAHAGSPNASNGVSHLQLIALIGLVVVSEFQLEGKPSYLVHNCAAFAYGGKARQKVRKVCHIG